MMLIRTYRVRGHLAAKLDPLGLAHHDMPVELTPAYHGFDDNELDHPIWLGGAMGFEQASIRELIAALQASYCGPIGFEYMHINDLEERRFIQERIEGQEETVQFTPEGKQVDPRKGHPRRAMGEIPRQEICRHQALRPRRRRKRDPGAGSGDQIWRPIWRQRHRRRHVAPRPPQRPHQRHGQALSRDLQRIRRRLGQPGRCRRVGRRQISPRHLAPTANSTGSRCICRWLPNPSHLEAVDPVVLGKARAVMTVRGDKEGDTVLADPAPRRRGLRRAGDRRRMLRLFRAARLRHRRHDPFHHQQPGRLHHQPAISRARRLTRRTSPSRSRRRSSTSTATIPKRSPSAASWRSSSASASTATSSSTCGATAASATTKATSRASPSR